MPGAVAEQLEIVENLNMPVFYADDVLAVEVYGNRARITYYEVKEMGGRPVRWPVCQMVRPVETVASNKLMMMVAEAVRKAASSLSAMFDLH